MTSHRPSRNAWLALLAVALFVVGASATALASQHGPPEEPGPGAADRSDQGNSSAAPRGEHDGNESGERREEARERAEERRHDAQERREEARERAQERRAEAQERHDEMRALHEACRNGSHEPRCHAPQRIRDYCEDHEEERRCQQFAAAHSPDKQARRAAHAVSHAIEAIEDRIVRLEAKELDLRQQLEGNLSANETAEVEAKLARIQDAQDRMLERIEHLQDRMERLQERWGSVQARERVVVCHVVQHDEADGHGDAAAAPNGTSGNASIDGNASAEDPAPGNASANETVTIRIARAALAAHLGHGDELGPCEGDADAAAHGAGMDAAPSDGGDEADDEDGGDDDAPDDEDAGDEDASDDESSDE